MLLFFCPYVLEIKALDVLHMNNSTSCNSKLLALHCRKLREELKTDISIESEADIFIEFLQNIALRLKNVLYL